MIRSYACMGAYRLNWIAWTNWKSSLGLQIFLNKVFLYSFYRKRFIYKKVFWIFSFFRFWLKLGLLCDLLWSDPDKNVKDWSPNDRGVSVTFPQEIIEKFLEMHDLDLVCRAHQVYLIFIYFVFYILNEFFSYLLF